MISQSNLAEKIDPDNLPTLDSSIKENTYISLLLRPHLRTVGVLLPISAIRRRDDLGIGDTRCIFDMVDFCRENRINIFQFLPPFETGGDNSPYNAISAMAFDLKLFTVECGEISTPLRSVSNSWVPGLTNQIWDQFAPSADVLSALRSGNIKYAEVKQAKLDLLTVAFDSFSKTDIKVNSELAQEFQRFKEDQSHWLPAYALFRALMFRQNENSEWSSWPAEQRSYQSATQWRDRSEQKSEINWAEEFFSYVQWVGHRQWSAAKSYANRNGVELMGDMPYGVSRNSSEVWQHPNLFELEWFGGAPPEQLFTPDRFTARWGQNWGNPPYNWEAHAIDGFKWWKERLIRTLDSCNTVRFDHALGPCRQYCFPWHPKDNHRFTDLSHDQVLHQTGGRLPHFRPHGDEPGHNAERNAARGEAFFRMLKETAEQRGAAIVAEDLGLVPWYMRPMLERVGIRGFALPLLERPWGTLEIPPARDLSAHKVATYGTHDHAPLKTLWEELVKRWHGPDGDNGWQEVQREMRFVGLNPHNAPKHFSSQLHEAFIRTLLNSGASVAIFAIQDILGTDERWNYPGVSDHTTWAGRIQVPLNELSAPERFVGKIKNFRRLVEESGRKGE